MYECHAAGPSGDLPAPPSPQGHCQAPRFDDEMWLQEGTIPDPIRLIQHGV